VRASLLAACLVVLAAGCGSDGSSSAHSTILKFDATPGTSSVFVLGDRSERVLPTEIYGVFRRSQREPEGAIAEHASEATEKACGVGSEEEVRPSLGEPDADTVRRLLRGLGKGQYDLVAMTTEEGAVALALDPNGSTACGQPTKEGLLFAAEHGGRDAIVYGLVGDDVKAVDLMIDGVTRRATLGENGFALDLPNPVGKTLEQVVLHDDGGSTTTFPAS
jgi:hypothetical protein